jgi:hypothetical protein
MDRLCLTGTISGSRHDASQALGEVLFIYFTDTANHHISTLQQEPNGEGRRGRTIVGARDASTRLE